MRLVVAVLAGFLLLAFPALAIHAPAPARCGESSAIRDMLKKKWGEYPAMSGMLTSLGDAMVVYANEATGTWTAVRFTPAGFACILGAGNNFNRFSKPKPKPKEQRANE